MLLDHSRHFMSFAVITEGKVVNARIGLFFSLDSKTAAVDDWDYNHCELFDCWSGHVVFKSELLLIHVSSISERREIQ